MKKEIIAFISGAVIVGAIWAGMTIFSNKADAPVTDIPGNTTTTATVTDQPHLLKKSVSDVYSATPDKNFPGLKLYNTDFLIPLNRLQITKYFVFDDPKANYGSGGHPMWNFIFSVEEKAKRHYFLAHGAIGYSVGQFTYLGEDITVEKIKESGDGYQIIIYKDKNGKQGGEVVPLQRILPEEPAVTRGIAQELSLDPLLKYAEKCDPFVWEMTAEELWKRLQQAVRENDGMTIAKMITFPMHFKGETIYTRAEFVAKFDEIFFPEYKAAVLKLDASEIWYSWRGACMPDNCSWLRHAQNKTSEAGPLELNPEEWKRMNIKKKGK